MFNKVLELFARRADAVAVVCSEWRDELVSRRVGKFDPGRIFVVPNGYDSELARQLLARDAARKLLGVPSSDKVILLLGRFSGQEYRLSELVRCMAKVKESIPGVRFVLAGDEPERLRHILTEENKRLPVWILGPIPRAQVAAWLSAADLCIGPLGPTQTVPLKVLEYLCLGRPTLVGTGSVSRDLESYTALMKVVAPNRDEIARAIVDLLRDPPPLDGALMERLRREYAWESIVGRLAPILEQVVRTHKDALKTKAVGD